MPRRDGPRALPAPGEVLAEWRHLVLRARQGAAAAPTAHYEYVYGVPGQGWRALVIEGGCEAEATGRWQWLALWRAERRWITRYRALERINDGQ